MKENSSFLKEQIESKNGAMFYFCWSVDDEYSICKCYSCNQIVGKARGCGYDMYSTAFVQFFNRTYKELLEKELSRGMSDGGGLGSAISDLRYCGFDVKEYNSEQTGKIIIVKKYKQCA